MNTVAGFPESQAVPAFRRPRSLIRAAQAGQGGWRRERDLPRLLRCHKCPEPALAIRLLQAEEERQNDLRLLREPDYDMRRHVLVMIAFLAELRANPVSAPGTAIPEHP